MSDRIINLTLSYAVFIFEKRERLQKIENNDWRMNNKFDAICKQQNFSRIEQHKGGYNIRHNNNRLS